MSTALELAADLAGIGALFAFGAFAVTMVAVACGKITDLTYKVFLVIICTLLGAGASFLFAAVIVGVPAL